MSKFEISKARLAEIIKEEYASLHENNPLTKTIDRWSEEGKGIPVDQTVGRMRNEERQYASNALERAGFRTMLNQIVDINEEPTERLFDTDDLREAVMEMLFDILPVEDASPVSERLTPDQLEIDEELLGKQKKENLEEAHCGTGHGTRDDKEEDKGKRSVEMGADDNPEETKMDHLPAKVLKKIAKKKKVKKESIDAIRELIKQELQR